jgi:hypothetical protein
MKRPFLFLLFLLLAPVVGCGGNRQTYANVKGTVTYNGKPLDKGEIVFTVQGRPATVMDIVDGKFTGQAVVGENKIAVTASKKNPGPPANLTQQAKEQLKGYKTFMKGKVDGGEVGEYKPAMMDYIPPEWGSASKQMRVVEAGAANEFEFHIKGPS